MFPSTRARFAALATAACLMAAGALSIPAAHSAELPANPAPAAVSTLTAADFATEQAVTTAFRSEVSTQQAAARVALARKAAIARTAAVRANVVKIALSRKGMAYSAGSAGPTAFDCSGFTSWVWKKAGKTIERTSWDQYATLKPVSRKNAKPGDLVFFFGGGAHHAALYLGHGKMIHAANYGSGVIITSVDDAWYGERLSGFRSVV